MRNIKTLEDYPDLDFIGGYTLEKLEDNMVSWYKERMKDLNGGKEVPLGNASRDMILLKVGAYYIYHAMKVSENNARMGTIKYATGEFLEALGAFKGVSRRAASYATATVRFSVASARSNATGIPKGTRVSAGDGVYFATNEYTEISAGSTYVDVRATCNKSGVDGNMYGVGEISKMVDVVPFIDTVSNTTAPEGGADEEDEEEFRENIFVAPNGYSAAGPEGAYESFVSGFSKSIIDIRINSPEPRKIEVRCLLENGVIPGDEFVSALSGYLSSADVKMLTDVVSVIKPVSSTYDIDISYYINKSDSVKAEMIQSNVTSAVNEYILWQKSKIGRDVNPSELIRRVVQAGAKRVIVRSPLYAITADNYVAYADNVDVVYGGLEDD